MRANLTLLAATAMILNPLGGASAAAQSPAAAAVPPSAMMRSKPKVDDIRLEVELFQQAPVDPQTGAVTVNGQGYGASNVKTSPTYVGPGVSIAVPVIVRTSWCDTDFTKGMASAVVDGFEQPQDPATCFSRVPGTAEAQLRFDARFQRGSAEGVLFKAAYQVQRWELQVDEGLAARATWPREWPSGMDRFLKAEFGINPALPAVKKSPPEPAAGSVALLNATRHPATDPMMLRGMLPPVHVEFSCTGAVADVTAASAARFLTS